MNIESELRKKLEQNGFTHKKEVTSFGWSYTHPIYMVVVYNAEHIFFNYLAKYMRDEVKKMNGTISDMDKFQKEELYRKALSGLEYYKDIKNSLKFSMRQSGNDFVGISEKVGFNILDKVLTSIITCSKTGEPLGRT